MTVQVRPARTLLQQARLAQWTTVVWMVIEGVVAIGAGIAARSVALTAFGVDSGIELFSSVVVLRRLLQRTESEERGSMTGGERGATKLVGFALYGLISPASCSRPAWPWCSASSPLPHRSESHSR